MKPSLLARLLLGLALCLPAAAFAKPALWVVKDADTTIYLFGTVHLLPDDTDWHYPGAGSGAGRQPGAVRGDHRRRPGQHDRAGAALRHRHRASAVQPARRRRHSRLDRAARLAGLPGHRLAQHHAPLAGRAHAHRGATGEGGPGSQARRGQAIARADGKSRQAGARAGNGRGADPLPGRHARRALQLDMLRSTLRETDNATRAAARR